MLEETVGATLGLVILLLFFGEWSLMLNYFLNSFATVLGIGTGLIVLLMILVLLVGGRDI